MGVTSRSVSRITPGQRSTSSGLRLPAHRPAIARTSAAPATTCSITARDFERRCAGQRTLQVHAGIDLAAAQAAGQQLACVVLEAAQVVGQAQRQLEVAVVHRTQLAGERAHGPGARAARSRSCCGSWLCPGCVPAHGHTGGRCAGVVYSREVYMTTGVPERPLQIEHADLSLVGNPKRTRTGSPLRWTTMRRPRGRGRHGRTCRRRPRGRVAIRAMVAEFWGQAGRCSIPTASCTSRWAARTMRSWRSPGLAAGDPAAPTCVACIVQGANAYWPMSATAASTCCAMDACTNARGPQSRRVAAARGPHHRAPGARSPDAQLRRVLHRRRSGAARCPSAAGARCRRATCCCCALTACVGLKDEQLAPRPGCGAQPARPLAELARWPCTTPRRSPTIHRCSRALARRLTDPDRGDST